MIITGNPVYNILCLIVGQLFLLNIVTGDFTNYYDNETNHEFSWQSAGRRSRRSPVRRFSNKLKLKIRLDDGTVLNVKWLQTEQFLANQYLPISMIPHDLPSSNEVMNNIGDFVMYQDIHTCSAVVYFEKSDFFYGVIGTDHYIKELPYIFNSRGTTMDEVKFPYIIKIDYSSKHFNPNHIPPPPSDSLAWKHFLHPVVEKSNTGDQHDTAAGTTEKFPINFGAGPSRKISTEEISETNPSYMQSHCGNKRPIHHHQSSTKKIRIMELDSIATKNTTMDREAQRIIESKKSLSMKKFNRYYLETLIVITKDFVDLFQLAYGDDYILWIVKYQIVYFNAVDMFISRLHDENEAIFHINIAKIMIETENYFDIIDSNYLQFSRTLARVRQHLHANIESFPRDSFDYIFISTSRPILDNSILTNALTTYGADMFEARRNEIFYDSVPISVVKYKHLYNDYLATIHQIGRLFDFDIDPYDNQSVDEEQCSSIMQREGPKCIKCLKWKIEHQRGISNFIKNNRNRCFLLNKPRSLLKPGPHMLIYLKMQCECYGYLPYSESAVPRNECALDLLCIEDREQQQYLRSTVRPVDGTSCGNKNVCWNKMCLPRDL